MTADGENKRALVVGAHPDDPDFGAGGTAALWTRDGWEFYYLVCTDGSKGSADPNMRPDQLISLRREEQRAAAAALGVKECFFLDYVDGELTVNRQLLGDITRIIRTIKPYAVFTHSIDVISRNSFINHSDHRAAAQTTIDAVYPTARDVHNFPEQIAEGLPAHNVREVYLWGAEGSNFEVDISEVLDTKVAGLMEHKSQFAHRGNFKEFVRERWKDESGRFVERFQKVTLAF